MIDSSQLAIFRSFLSQKKSSMVGKTTVDANVLLGDRAVVPDSEEVGEKSGSKSLVGSENRVDLS